MSRERDARALVAGTPAAHIEKVRVWRARIIIKREEGDYEEADYRLGHG